MRNIIAIFVVSMFVGAVFAGKDECYTNNCFALISENTYLTEAKSLQSDYDLKIARQLLECKCLDDFKEYKRLRKRLRKMVEAYESIKCAADIKICDNLISSGSVMYNYSSSSKIWSQNAYETAKEIVEKCECWTTTRKNRESYYRYCDLFKKMRGMINDYEQWLPEKQRQEEITRQMEEDAQRIAKELAKEQARRRAHQDSIRKIEEPKEIATLLNKPGKIEECFIRCRDFSEYFGEEPDICSNDLVKKVKSLSPSQITSQEVAEVYFTPIINLAEWYMEDKQSGYVQFGGDVSWVSGNLAEMTMGNDFSFLIKFSSPWIIREGMQFMGYGKPVGNVTYRTAFGASRTLPCLKILWKYRPSLDK